MAKVRIVSRRSFLADVTGASLLAGGALLLGAGPALARRRATTRMIVDADPRDPARPIGVAPPRPVARRRAGITDSDSGPTADPAGAGAGSAGGPAPVSRFVVCPGNRRCPRRGR